MQTQCSIMFSRSFPGLSGLLNEMRLDLSVVMIYFHPEGKHNPNLFSPSSSWVVWPMRVAHSPSDRPGPVEPRMVRCMGLGRFLFVPFRSMQPILPSVKTTFTASTESLLSATPRFINELTNMFHCAGVSQRNAVRADCSSGPNHGLHTDAVEDERQRGDDAMFF